MAILQGVERARSANEKGVCMCLVPGSMPTGSYGFVMVLWNKNLRKGDSMAKRMDHATMGDGVLDLWYCRVMWTWAHHVAMDQPFETASCGHSTPGKFHKTCHLATSENRTHILVQSDKLAKMEAIWQRAKINPCVSVGHQEEGPKVITSLFSLLVHRRCFFTCEEG